MRAAYACETRQKLICYSELCAVAIARFQGRELLSRAVNGRVCGAPGDVTFLTHQAIFLLLPRCHTTIEAIDMHKFAQ